MLTVTESALAHLAAVLEPEEDARGLRLVNTEEGLALVADTPRDDDEVHERAGRPVLLVDRGMSAAIDGRTLDIADAGGEPHLTLV